LTNDTMAESAFTALRYFFNRYPDHSALQTIQEKLSTTRQPSNAQEIDGAIQSYKEAIQLIENEIWAEDTSGPDESLIKRFQQLYRELEQLISLKGDDRRHRFIITIPVADRPQHLQSCLASLLTLCQKFNYGGSINGRFPKVMVLVADDSKDEANISRHREIARQFDAGGIETLYFGIDEQLQQLAQLSDSERDTLQGILGDIDSSAFYHKGASIMRNIAYLKLRELTQNNERSLCYFIDSDQEFQVKIQMPDGEKDLYAISFLHALDQIFTQENIEILTGKVVGDPPVSPSVMAGNFLEDVSAFLHQMAEVKPATACQLHNHDRQWVDDASYHDMAELFGFKPTQAAYHYNCTLSSNHDHSACFKEFARKLNLFFDGAHPTRKSYYEHTELITSIAPARTIYTGNYIFRPTALNYFIPFATLKLRMAGPVLGRIIKAERGQKFVSANLPMLHKRTVDETGQSEFRPGISRETEHIDLSGEFERQFFGDVMLFTMEHLTAEGYPQKPLTKAVITAHVSTIEKNIQQKYQDKQQSINNKLQRLKKIFNDPKQWWNNADAPDQTLNPALQCFNQFITNIEHNFGKNSRTYKLIGATANRNQRLQAITEAIIHYNDDRSNWENRLQQ